MTTALPCPVFELERFSELHIISKGGPSMFEYTDARVRRLHSLEEYAD